MFANEARGLFVVFAIVQCSTQVSSWLSYKHKISLNIAWDKHYAYFVALSVMKKICFIILMQSAHIMKYLVFAAIADIK